MNSSGDPTVGPLRVLIADDSAEDRFACRRFVTQGGQPCVVTEADHGAATIRQCLAEPPDCLLLDYRFPDLTGIEVLEELARAGVLVRIAVVMLTGQGSEAVAVAAMKLGVQDYLAKRALSPETLWLSIRNGVEKVRLRLQLEQQREALLRSHRELERFACVVAHDLQTPLTGMTMFLTVLRSLEGTAMDEQAKRYLDMALSASERMRRMITDLLHFSRAGGTTGSFEAVDLRQLAQEIWSSLEAVTRESCATITIADLPTVQGHRVELGQVLQNLLENALRYRASEPPRITIACTRDGDFWQLCVADNGIGVAPEHHQEIFRAFHRLHRYDEIPGNGLGLAICKKVIEYHGGRIWIESKLGRGTKIYFTLPALVK